MADDADSLRSADVPVSVGVLGLAGLKLTFFITACVVLGFELVGKCTDNTPTLRCGCGTVLTQGQDLLFS